MKYWLMKSEPTSYSIDDLKRDKKTAWEGVRNYQARNYMREMEPGDLVLFYHSSTEPTGVYGVAKVASKPHPDMSQFDRKNKHYYDPKARKEKPIWDCVDIAFVKKLAEPVTLGRIKDDPKLSGMMVAQRGSRLSVQPVSEKHFKAVEKIGLER